MLADASAAMPLTQTLRRDVNIFTLSTRGRVLKRDTYRAGRARDFFWSRRL
jgi:hypothetical protein